MKTKTILFTGANSVELDDAEIPDPGHGEVIVQATYTCISPGTELRCFAGKQEGAAPWPFIPGYSMVGQIVRRGAGTSLPEGTTVFCGGTTRANRGITWGAHIGHAVRHEASLIPIPEGVDLVEASTAKLAAIAYHGVRLSRPQLGECVACVGLGAIGQFSARLHTLSGAHVVAADLSAARVAAAQAAGVEAIVATPDLASAFRPIFPEGANIVVDSTGAAAVLPQALALTRDLAWDDALYPASRFVVQGSYPSDFVVPYSTAFMKEVTILVPRDQQARDLHAVLDLMSRGKLAGRDVVTEVRRPEEAPRTYAQLQQAPGDLLTVAFDWR